MLTVLLAALALASCAPKQEGTGEPGALERTVLPIKEPAYPAITELDARKAKAPARFEVKAPDKAPNVVIVLIDDIGFGHSSAFGGPINMPTLERLAANGLKYNRFHTTALCSPTRTALLTGYNHHSNNAGAIMEVGTAFPGNTGIRPQTITPVAQVLRMNGYNTAAFGKYHETPPWEASVSGPYDRWPTGSGFEKFYGFIGGETNQWHPMVYDGTTRVYPNVDDPEYHFTTDMTDQALAWMNTQQSLTPDKPFYLYFATGATHAPHHAPQAFVEKYKGKFAQGWDKLRTETLERQKTLGVVPQNTVLAPKPADIKFHPVNIPSNLTSITKGEGEGAVPAPFHWTGKRLPTGGLPGPTATPLASTSRLTWVWMKILRSRSLMRSGRNSTGRSAV
jgi:arylsulfatase